MSMLRKIQRVGKRATKFQYTATYQSIVIECLRDKWRPSCVCVSWTRRGRRFITKTRPWQPSPDNKMRGVVIWPDPETMEITVTLYKGPKDKSYETKEWEFAVIDVDSAGKRKVLATTSINMVRYASSMPYDNDLTLRLKPVSRKIKSVILQVQLSSVFLKEGKATDEDMMSIASMMSVSNLSTIGFLEDDDDEYWTGGRSVSPPSLPDHVLSTDELLKWAKEVTADTPSVKIMNMTTAWRNGIGFLAVIHYYRPDLVPDFDMLSPTSIKENNRLAFELARGLGIACPLTPNMMVTTTVPDKLAVTSFVYQLHQYFTRATQSAVARQEGANTPSSPTDGGRTNSPFDIGQIPKMFSGGMSPVSTPPPSTDKLLNLYSRHSRDNSQASLTAADPATSSAASGVTGSSSVGDVGRTVAGSDVTQTNAIDNTGSDVAHTGASGKAGGDVGGRKASVESLPENAPCDLERSVSPASRAKLQLDLLVKETPPVQPDLTRRKSDSVINFGTKQTAVETVAAPATRGGQADDSALEYEFETESSEPLTTTETTSSYPAVDDHNRYPDLPMDPNPLSSQAGGRRNSRKLPSLPSDADSQSEVAKREERRRQAKEMLRKHKIKVKPGDSMKTNSSSSIDSKYRKQAIQMLTDAFNSPRGSLTNLNDQQQQQPDDKSSLGDSGSSASLKRHYSTGSIPSPVSPDPPKTENTVTVEKPKSPSKSSKNESTTTQAGRPSSAIVSKTTKKLAPSKSASNIKPGGVSEQPRKRVLTDEREKSSGGTSQAAGKPKRQLPAVRPLSAQPSQNLVKLAEKKKQEEDEERARKEREERLAAEAVKEQAEGQVEEDTDQSPAEGKPSHPHRESRVTPVHKMSLPSPAWSNHSEDLDQDLLVTQSEYVRTELLGLREQLGALEDNAGNMETRVREAMANGDKEKEEDLMQEWFGILNKKNELIKRQIELNIIEKEEDLEKRQFFINRELRPLMALSEEEKTSQQKEREGQLLEQLIKLVDERDKLERGKLSTERSSDHERVSFASAQAASADIVNADSEGKQSKDCVIS